MNLTLDWIREVGELLHRVIRPNGYVTLIYEGEREGDQIKVSSDSKFVALSNLGFTDKAIIDLLRTTADRMESDGAIHEATHPVGGDH